MKSTILLASCLAFLVLSALVPLVVVLGGRYNGQEAVSDVHIRGDPSKTTNTEEAGAGERTTTKPTEIYTALRNMEAFTYLATARKNKDCFCPHGRPNRIYYTNCPRNGAGIKDRQNILRNVLWWADELCARVSLKCSPSVFLGKEHGCFAPETATWDDYFTTGRVGISTGQQSFRIKALDGIFDYVPLLNGSNIDQTTIIVSDLRTFHGPNLARQATGTTTGLQGYHRALEFKAQNISFLWRFDISFWDSDLYTWRAFGRAPDKVLPHREYTDQCGMIDFAATKIHMKVAQLLLNAMNIMHVEEFVTVHLRRGDYRECDTEPVLVLDYLNCSIPEVMAPRQNDTTTTAITNTVLVFTNAEREYKEELSTLFHKTNSREAMKLIFVDDVIVSPSFLTRLRQNEGFATDVGARILQDNCYRWQILKVIIAISETHLERGHISCNKCDLGGVDRKKNVVR